MKWLLLFSLALALLLVLAYASRHRIRQAKAFVLNRYVNPRSSTDAITPTPKDVERHREFLERIKRGNIDLVFFGDSITDGWTTEGENTWSRFAIYSPANFGVSGDRTEHLLWRLQNGELEGINPKVVVLLIGTNNIGAIQGERPEWVFSGVEKIVETIRSRLPNATIVLHAIFPRDASASDSRKRVGEVNEKIAKLADGKKIIFADFGASFLDANGEISADVMPDGLHLSRKAYDIWYQQLEPLLAKLMAQPSVR